MLKVLASLIQGVSIFKPCFKARMLCLLFSAFLCKQVKSQDLSCPKFFKLNLQSLPFSATPSIPQLGALSTGSNQSDPEYGPNFLYEVALRYPIKLKGRTKLIGEISHKNEFVYGYYSSELDESEELELFQTSNSFILIHEISRNAKFTNALQVSSNSARGLALTGGALRFSNLGLYEKNLSNGKFGVGLALSYDQRLSILPLLKYETDLGKDWAIEALLPSKLLLVKNISIGSRFYFGLRGSTATYLINDNDAVSDDLLGTSYRRMSAHGVVGYEKMLTPMIGLSAEMGVAVPMRSGIYDRNGRGNVLRYDFNNNKVSPHFNIGFFLALPNK